MAYKRIQVSAVPKRSRKGTSRFEKTAEWKLMSADLAKGLKPNEALQVILTDEDKKKYRIQNRRTVARFIQKFLAAHKLPYDVKSFNRDGADFVVVQYTPHKR